MNAVPAVLYMHTVTQLLSYCTSSPVHAHSHTVTLMLYQQSCTCTVTVMVLISVLWAMTVKNYYSWGKMQLIF